jgi:dipicolinate synthase subunit A
MVDNIKIAVLGGDRRQIYALSALACGNRRIAVYGIPRESVSLVSSAEIEYAERIEEALEGAKVVLLPFPASADGVRINCPLDACSDSEVAHKNAKLSTVEKYVDKDALIIGGRLPLPFVLSVRQNGFRVTDLLEVEGFEMKNAYISAEAATSIAMNSLSKNIRGAKIAVTGFGRISKHLCRLLSLLGADVTACARRLSDLVYAETLGYATLMIKGERWCDSLAKGYDMIFNTVPDRIFDREFLASVDKGTLMVELASAPGGFDIGAAQEFGSNLSWALSLPGKYAPESAGEMIGETVLEHLKGDGRL